jgi:dipeptidyl aminopeptidase/acylaminoacyl peptidase
LGRELTFRVAFGVVLAACRTPSEPAVTIARAIPSATASAIATTPREEPPKTFRELPAVRARVVGKATTKKLPFRNASGMTVAPDGKTFFVDASSNGTPGGFVVSDAHPSGVFFGTSEVHDARFSSDGKKLLVYNDERDVATVLSVPDGAVLHDETRVLQARFDGAALVTWNGCQIVRDGTPVGPKICGGADASDDGRTWIVVTPERHGRPLSMRTYDELQWIDARTGVARSLAHGVGEVRISPKGDFVCAQTPRLWCFDFARGAEVEMPRLQTYRFAWDDDGVRFVAAPFRFDDLVVVDMAARTVRHVALDAEIRYLSFVPGGRIAAWDKGAWMIDPATGETIELFPKTVEVGGLAVIPGARDRVFMGNESGASRDWFEVRVPSAANVSLTRPP